MSSPSLASSSAQDVSTTKVDFKWTPNSRLTKGECFCRNIIVGTALGALAISAAAFGGVPALAPILPFAAKLIVGSAMTFTLVALHYFRNRKHAANDQRALGLILEYKDQNQVLVDARRDCAQAVQDKKDVVTSAKAVEKAFKEYKRDFKPCEHWDYDTKKAALEAVRGHNASLEKQCKEYEAQLKAFQDASQPRDSTQGNEEFTFAAAAIPANIRNSTQPLKGSGRRRHASKVPKGNDGNTAAKKASPGKKKGAPEGKAVADVAIADNIEK